MKYRLKCRDVIPGCLPPLLAGCCSHTWRDSEGAAGVLLFSLFLNINWKLKLKAMWPLYNLNPRSFPRLFCELNGQVSKTRTWHLNEVQASWSEKGIEQKKGKLKLTKRAGRPTTKAGRQRPRGQAEIPGLQQREGSRELGNSVTN